MNTTLTFLIIAFIVILAIIFVVLKKKESETSVPMTPPEDNFIMQDEPNKEVDSDDSPQDRIRSEETDDVVFKNDPQEEGFEKRDE